MGKGAVCVLLLRPPQHSLPWGEITTVGLSPGVKDLLGQLTPSHQQAQHLAQQAPTQPVLTPMLHHLLV